MASREVHIDSDADDEIIADVKAFIRDHPPLNLPAETMLSVEKLRSFGYTPNRLYPVASEKEITEAETAIGFSIPNLLRRLYLEVNNGIEGFSYRIFGLDGGCAGSAGTLVHQYRDLKAGFEYLGKSDQWKPGTLPFCDWGCTICSCVDCTDPSGSVSTCEECNLCPEDYTLDDFFRMWVKGKVRYTEGADDVAKTITNPFTGEVISVPGRRRRQPSK